MTEGCVVLKKICAVAAISAATVFGAAGAASADTVGTELKAGWSWYSVAGTSTDIASWVLDVSGLQGDTPGWSWYRL
ncbi:hypothetical protein [Nocardiopsis ansamitocini]|uniref:Uncharacterized protein n=1 Tax=Nocardiopsis ansamitocini TaxID=1670832 RepID=A0A9W6P4J9_9ACTN|nr:hypothetical protein [Nocardiopsis ansamitocini]GLU46942.1 hypothetical protein Nans01_12930 [Nocardiopsis ansamitocini]